jgi:hypothetical protein
VNGYVPAAFAVPRMLNAAFHAPPDVAVAKEGSPDSVHVYGVVPPLALAPMSMLLPRLTVSPREFDSASPPGFWPGGGDDCAVDGAEAGVDGLPCGVVGFDAGVVAGFPWVAGPDAG